MALRLPGVGDAYLLKALPRHVIGRHGRKDRFVGGARRRQPATRQVAGGRTATRIDGRRHGGLDPRQIDMAGVEAAGSGDPGRGLAQLAALEPLLCLVQQVGQRVLPAFERLDPRGLQRQYAAVQRQRRVLTAPQPFIRVGARGRCEQSIDTGVLDLARAQPRRERVGLRARHLQLACQGQSRTCLLEPVLPQRIVRRREGRLRHAAQALARLGAVGIQRLRRFIQLARTRAIGSIHPPGTQGLIRLVEQRLHAGLRPQQVGQRLAQDDDRQDEQDGKRHCREPACTPSVTSRRDRRAGVAVGRRRAVRPVDARLDASARSGVVVVFAGHARSIPTQPERRASSTPGSASSLPSSVDS